MENRSYWRITFTGTSWQEFIDSGSDVYGVSARYKSSLERTKIGDFLLCYVVGISRFIGLAEVISIPFYDNSDIWLFGLYPCRIKVKPIQLLSPETAVPIATLKDKLPMFQTLKNPLNWAMLFSGSIRKLSAEDGKIILKSIKEAAKEPIIRPYKKNLFDREPL